VTNRGRAATVVAPSRFVAVMTVIRVLFVRLALVVLIAAGVMAPSAPERAQAQDCEYGAFGCGHAEQHHQYLDWKPRTGKGSCCNGDDCRPVKARTEDDGSWSVWSPEFRQWVPVPAFAVGEPDRFGDGRSHVCSTRPMLTVPVFHIFCFSPTGSKS
jgi:hypothetical protein